jgi:hypothetical protein
MVSRPERRTERRRPRASRGPPGPGTAVVVVVVAVLAIFVVLGLTGGSGGGGGQSSTTTQAKKKRSKPKQRRVQPKPKPRTVRLKIVPTGITYLCVDRGVGTPILFNNTTSRPQSFRGKHLRVNIGDAANARVFSNGKKVPITRQAVTIGYEFTPTRSKPLPAGQRRPCA